MNNTSKFKTGLLSGIIAGIIYTAILFARYKWFGSNPQELGLISGLGFAVLILIFFITAYTRKKQLGGYADVKELFGTIFIVIICAEICFSLFNFIYLKYIDPGYLARFTTSTMEWMAQNKLPEEQAKDIINGLKGQQEITFGTIMMGFARSVILDSIIGIVIAFIMKSKRPATA